MEKDINLVFFEENLESFLSDNTLKDKYIVISDASVKGAYDDFSAALEFASANFQEGEFIIQQVINENEQINFLRSAI